ncbi:hypothetical protein E4U54_002166, partial [Claviceps lovelessii]
VSPSSALLTGPYQRHSIDLSSMSSLCSLSSLSLSTASSSSTSSSASTSATTSPSASTCAVPRSLLMESTSFPTVTVGGRILPPEELQELSDQLYKLCRRSI